MAKFKIGQRVICVEDKFLDYQQPHRNIACPEKGIIYTIRNYVNKGIVLKEIRNFERQLIGSFAEPAFKEYHFEPLKEETKTKTEYKVVEIDKSLKEKREEVIYYN